MIWKVNGIPNFAAVEPGIYRGGQPDANGWKYLQELGVTQVIKLNEDSEAIDHVPEGMALFKVQIPQGEQIITEPNMQYLEDAIGFIEPNTLVHCQHGQDRTGLVIGMYRVRQGWSKSRAYDEMIAFGFHPELFGLAKAWEDFKASDEQPIGKVVCRGKA